MLEFLDPNRLCVRACMRCCARHRPRACGFGHEIDLRVETYHDQIRTLHNFRPARPWYSVGNWMRIRSCMCFNEPDDD